MTTVSPPRGKVVVPQPIPGHDSSGTADGSAATSDLTPWDGATSDFIRQRVAMPPVHSSLAWGAGMPGGVAAGVGVGVLLGGALANGAYKPAGRVIGGFVGAVVGAGIAAATIGVLLHRANQAAMVGVTTTNPQSHMPVPTAGASQTGEDGGYYQSIPERAEAIDVVDGDGKVLQQWVTDDSVEANTQHYGDAIQAAEAKLGKIAGKPGNQVVAVGVFRSADDFYAEVPLVAVPGEALSAPDQLTEAHLQTTDGSLVGLVTDSRTYVGTGSIPKD